MWMLYGEFIYLLRDLGHRWPWHIDRDHCIRTLEIEGRAFCPITAACATVCYEGFDPESYRAGAAALGLDPETADAVAQAADLAGAYNAHCRADLSDALRLGEPWGQEGRWNDPAFHNHPYPHGNDRPMVRGGIFTTSAMPVGHRALSRCTTRPPIGPSLKPRFASIEESARIRSILSALSAVETETPSPPLPVIAAATIANSRAKRAAG